MDGLRMKIFGTLYGRSDQQRGIQCITEYDGFSAFCLNEHVIQTAYYQYRQQYGRMDEDNRYVVRLYI